MDVINRPGKCVVMGVTALALVAVASVETAFARKNRVTATVDGKRYKWKGRYVLSSFDGTGTAVVAVRPGKTIRGLGFACPIFPPSEAFPVSPSPTVCNGTYSVKRRGVLKSWFAPRNVQMTFDSYEEGRIVGRFAGMLDALGTGEKPMAISGEFDMSTEQSRR